MPRGTHHWSASVIEQFYSQNDLRAAQMNETVLIDKPKPLPQLPEVTLCGTQNLKKITI
jgi:hypothetical protein